MGTYDVYKKRVNAYGSTIREGRLNTMINRITNSFEDSPSYFEVTFNTDKDKKGVHIIDDSTAINNTNQYSKIIIMQPGEILKVGDVLAWKSKTWLCVACEMVGDVYFHGKIIQCQHHLTVYKNGVSSQIPACVDNGVRLYQMGTNETRLAEIPEGVLILRVPDNNTTALLKRGEVYQVGRQYYKVNDIQDAIEPGLLVLRMEWTSEPPEDIPTPTPPSDFEIVGADRILKNESESYSVDHDEQVTFSITGTFATIAEQENNSCTLKASSNIGEVTLTATAGEFSASRVIRIVGLF